MQLSSLIRDGLLDPSALSEAAKIDNQLLATQSFKMILEAANYVKKEQVPLALVTGAHGTGKTTALRFYNRHSDSLFKECPPKYREKDIATDLANMLGISTGRGWRLRTSVVVEQLKMQPRIIIFDEAQRMDYHALDYLKYIADSSKSSFMLGASASLAKRIERWPDISTRVGVRVYAQPMSQEEFLSHYQTDGPDGYSQDSLKEMHRLSKGVMRTILNIFKQLEDAQNYQASAGNSIPNNAITPAHIRELAGKVVLYGQPD